MKVASALGAVFALLAALPAEAFAQPYPSKPIRVVVAFAAGGFADTIARLVGHRLAERVGQPVVVENRGGAGGNIAARAVAAAPADGYTLLVHTAAIAINPSLYRSPGFDLAADLVPVANTGSTPGVFVVHASNPAHSLQELLRSGRRITFSSAGVGTSSHLAGEYFFKVLARAEAEHVPFQGGAPALTAVLSGTVEVLSTSMPPVVPHLRKGSLKVLSVSSLARVAALPDVPTVGEAGFADFEERSWVGFFAPARTPGAVVERLNAEIRAVAGLPEVLERFSALGMDPHPMSSPEFAAYVRREVAKWATVVRATGIGPVE
ncbi:MAG TPA: tripartite tricarboxylate transporter substrate-binding protein [Burkholderiales bacterium]|nr:tripartite tricarboxylate transporter substrate-binding protein [Burkholderiales bacterium]